MKKETPENSFTLFPPGGDTARRQEKKEKKIVEIVMLMTLHEDSEGNKGHYREGIYHIWKCLIVVVQSLSRAQLFVTPWTAACQASLSFTVSRSWLKLMSIESVIPSHHLIFCHPFLLLPPVFPASGSFSMYRPFASGGQSIGASVSASVLPMNIQDWFPLGWTGWISLQSKGLSRITFSNLKVPVFQCSAFFMIKHSQRYRAARRTTWKSEHVSCSVVSNSLWPHGL